MRSRKSQHVTIENASVRVTLSLPGGELTVYHRPSERTWRQTRVAGIPRVLRATKSADGREIRADLRASGMTSPIGLRISLPARDPEFHCELAGDGPMAGPVPYPGPFQVDVASFLVLPTNEGHLYPTHEVGLPPLRMRGLHGHDGFSMPWYGQCIGEDGPGIMTIVETPADMSLLVDHVDGDGSPLGAWCSCEPSFSAFSYSRVLRYVVIPNGGYVAQAKRYREHAAKKGLLKTLREKREENPSVDRLVGAANVWAFRWPSEMDKVALVREMKALGIDRILWSGGGTPKEVRALNRFAGVLTSRFCTYQDTYPPGKPTRARHWGWPDAVARQADGSPQPGWTIRGRAGRLYPGAVICSKPGRELVWEDVTQDLSTTPYRCRFVDTTCASAMIECHDSRHAQTRAEDLASKMEILRFCSAEKGLVTGTECGIDASVPYVHYYEGMLSLARYRLPDSGYEMLAYKPPTPEFMKFQVGPYYRVPLWELVYHDCAVSHWYWGDSSNKAPEVWDQRDLINALYGTPPMFFLSPEVWQEHKHRCAQSYRRVVPIARELGYDEMLSHEFLTRDHTLQRTVWASGVAVVANFADYPQTVAGGDEVKPANWVVQQQ